MIQGFADFDKVAEAASSDIEATGEVEMMKRGKRSRLSESPVAETRGDVEGAAVQSIYILHANTTVSGN